MAKPAKRINCPACAHQLDVEAAADITHFTCPHCEAEIPVDALRGEVEIAEEIAPGFRPGQQLGNYVIESLLGAGGMAVVFRARQLSLDRFVALKILPKEYAKNKMFVGRFASEAAVLAGLNHPNIVSVIDRGNEGGVYFIVMEYVEGDSLKERLDRKGRLKPAVVFPIARQVLAGLDYSHRRGVVHRDIKPGNIMISREKVVKITDFGLAHLAKQQGGADATRDNQTMGTLKYMAPEQLARAKYVDGRADLYSLGVCIYEMLTGKLPVGTFKMPSEFDPSLDIRWDDLIFRVLKMEPEERYQDAKELAQALEELATTPHVTIREVDLKEQEEEARAREKAAAHLTGCPSCGHENAPTVRVCERCGAKLADLFENCPACGKENRVDVSVCPGCGANLDVHRVRLRRKAETIQTNAKELVARARHDSALVELKKLLTFRTREYAAVRESARLWIERIKRRREQFYQRTYEAGRRMIAERRYERALEIWEPLPDDYRDTEKWREEISLREQDARSALKKGNRLYKEGNVIGAVEEWKEAADFWPGNAELRQRLLKAQDQLGNLNLKQSYLREAREVEARGNFAEAISLCRHVLELDPDDATTLSFLEELAAQEREHAESQAPAESQIILPGGRAGRRSRRKRGKAIAAVASALAVIAVIVGLAALLIFVYRPYAIARRTRSAARLLSQAENLRSRGKLEDAIRLCEELLARYAGTVPAEEAGALAEEMRTMIEEARAACEGADAVAKRGDFNSLAAGFKRFRELRRTPPVAEIEEYRVYSGMRLDALGAEVVKALAEQATEHERKGDWHAALERYKAAVEEYGASGEPISSRLRRAKERIERCGEEVARAREAFDARNWQEAATLCASALDLVPADPDAHDLLRRTVPKLAPPGGMVLVPAGDYAVGGVEGRPKQVVVIPNGFFIDQTEVTNARYAEFVRSAGRPAPPGWTDAALPPPGSEQTPVVNVTWEDARAFASWAGCALPTENQWESAARGPAGSAYPWGDRWDSAAPVLGFGPAQVGTAERDRSRFGVMDLAGNAAEWTATRAEALTSPPEKEPADRAASPRGSPQIELPRGRSRGDNMAPPKDVSPSPAGSLPRYIVKGGSWAGMEEGRPTVVVPRDGHVQGGSRTRDLSGRAPASPPAPANAASAQGERSLVLTANAEAPELPVEYAADIRISYLGQFGTIEGASVLVARWIPEWRRWVEARFSVVVDGSTPIGEARTIKVAVGSTDSQQATHTVDFSTGCVAVRQDPKEWLEIRDRSGALRRLPYIGIARVESVTLPAERSKPAGSTVSAAARTLAASRMIGRADGRYLNVGFRCVKLLWSPPEAEAKEKPEP